MRLDDEDIHIPPILDACCGGKHFWFNKENPNVLFMDVREVPKGTIPQQPNWSVSPDLKADFRDMPFADETFHLVVFDPPHAVTDSDGIITTKYGKLDGEWEEDFRKGFEECWRVLKPFGVLQFKFNDVSVPINKILKLFPVEPLFGTKTKKGVNNTFWFTYMKGVS